jgi:hypothetical protein
MTNEKYDALGKAINPKGRNNFGEERIIKTQEE